MGSLSPSLSSQLIRLHRLKDFAEGEGWWAVCEEIDDMMMVDCTHQPKTWHSSGVRRWDTSLIYKYTTGFTIALRPVA